MTNFEAIKSAIADMDLDELAYFCYNYPDCHRKFGFTVKANFFAIQVLVAQNVSRIGYVRSSMMFDVHTSTIWTHLTALLVSCLFIGLAASHFYVSCKLYKQLKNITNKSDEYQDLLKTSLSREHCFTVIDTLIALGLAIASICQEENNDSI